MTNVRTFQLISLEFLSGLQAILWAIDNTSHLNAHTRLQALPNIVNGADKHIAKHSFNTHSKPEPLVGKGLLEKWVGFSPCEGNNKPREDLTTDKLTVNEENWKIKQRLDETTLSTGRIMGKCGAVV